MQRGAIRFSVYVGGKLIEEIEVDRPVFNIGKLSTSTVRLDDINVSRKHAVVERLEDGSWRVTDLASTNGTRLGGEPIEQAPLRDGDRLVIGRTTLVVHIAAPSSADAAPAPAPTLAAATEVPAPRPAAPARPARVPETMAAPAWRGEMRPAPTLPRGAAGLLVVIVGALFLLVSVLVMPWRHYALAGVDASALEGGIAGWLGALAGFGALGAAGHGLASGRRFVGGRAALAAGAVAALGLVVAAAGGSGERLMLHEATHLGGGFFVALWGALLIVAGAALGLAALPRWDATTSFLRVMVARADRPVHDVVVYEPRTLDLGPDLPRFSVSREGDVTMQRAGQAPERVRNGARGSVDVGDARVLYLFVRPLPGRRATPLTHWSESLAFGTLALLFALSIGVYAILGLDAEALREAPPFERRQPQVEIATATPEDEVRTVQVDLPEPDLAEPTVDVQEGERYGDEAVPDELADAGAMQEPGPSDFVDRLDRPRDAVDPSLSPSERAERARELAAETALADVLREDNPMLAALSALDGDVDRRVDILAAIDKQGTFVAGATDPFGGTLTGGGGFPDGAPGGTDPEGGPGDGDPDGPAITGLDPRPVRPDLPDIVPVDRPIVPIIHELPPRVRGEHDEKLIQMHIRRYLAGIKACYQERLQSDRGLTGRMTLAFTILPSGSVIDAHTTDNTLGDAALDTCVVTKMSRWRFPAPTDGGTADVTYRIILKAR